jgi:acetyl esterase/lipase
VFSQDTYVLSTHTYKTVSGHGIQVDVYQPSLPAENPRPVILYIHGGALVFGFRGWILPWQLQKYIDAGFILASID